MADFWLGRGVWSEAGPWGFDWEGDISFPGSSTLCPVCYAPLSCLTAPESAGYRLKQMLVKINLFKLQALDIESQQWESG